MKRTISASAAMSMNMDCILFRYVSKVEPSATWMAWYNLNMDYFNDGQRTVLLLCEDGEEEYDQEFLSKRNCRLIPIQDQEGLNTEFLNEVGPSPWPGGHSRSPGSWPGRTGPPGGPPGCTSGTTATTMTIAITSTATVNTTMTTTAMSTATVSTTTDTSIITATATRTVRWPSLK